MIEAVLWMAGAALAVMVLLVLYSALDDILHENARYNHRKKKEPR